MGVFLSGTHSNYGFRVGFPKNRPRLGGQKSHTQIGRFEPRTITGIISVFCSRWRSARILCQGQSAKHQLQKPLTAEMWRAALDKQNTKPAPMQPTRGPQLKTELKEIHMNKKHITMLTARFETTQTSLPRTSLATTHHLGEDEPLTAKTGTRGNSLRSSRLINIPFGPQISLGSFSHVRNI